MGSFLDFQTLQLPTQAFPIPTHPTPGYDMVVLLMNMETEPFLVYYGLFPLLFLVVILSSQIRA